MPLVMTEAELGLIDLALSNLSTTNFSVLNLRGRIAEHSKNRQKYLKSQKRQKQEILNRKRNEKLPKGTLHHWLMNEAELNLRPHNSLKAKFSSSTPMETIVDFARNKKLMLVKNLGVKSERAIINELKRTGYLGEDEQYG